MWAQAAENYAAVSKQLAIEQLRDSIEAPKLLGRRSEIQARLYKALSLADKNVWIERAKEHSMAQAGPESDIYRYIFALVYALPY